jgi:hypothetical protein
MHQVVVGPLMDYVGGADFARGIMFADPLKLALR